MTVGTWEALLRFQAATGDLRASQDWMKIRSRHRWEGIMEDDSAKPKQDEVTLLSCSFCGASQHEVRKLIAGPTVYICDQCIQLCNDIIAEEQARDGLPRPSRKRSPKQELDEIADILHRLANRLPVQWTAVRPDAVEALRALIDHLESVESAIRATLAELPT